MASTCPSGIGDVVCHVMPYVPIVGGYYDVGGKAASTAIDAAGNSVLSQVAQSMASAADGLLKTLTTFWMNIDTPSMGASSPVTTIEQQTGWITTCVAVVCILIAAARMAIRRRGEPAAIMMMGLVRLVVVCAAGTFLVEAAGKLSDMFSADIMSTAHLGTGGWSGVISTAGISAAFASGDGMLLIVALLIVISSLIQLMLMVLRVGLLIILTGTLPLAAAASMSEWGEDWWRKHLAWLTAWLLYKPAAAVLYAGAFALTRNGGSLVEVLAGFMLLILSVLTLPALLKVIVPMTAHLGAAAGGGLAMGVTGAMATGAIKVAAMAGKGGAAAAAAPSGNSVPAGSNSPSERISGATSPPGASAGSDNLGSTSSQNAGGAREQSPRGSRPDGEQGSAGQPAGKQPPAGDAAGQTPAGAAGAADSAAGTGPVTAPGSPTNAGTGAAGMTNGGPAGTGGPTGADRDDGTQETEADHG